MIKLLKSKIFIGTICLLLAAVLAFGLLPRLYKSQASTIQIVTLKQTVESGTEITEGMISATEVGSFGLPEGVVTNQADVIGLVANSTLYGGEYLWRDRFITAEEYKKASNLDYELKNGSYLLTVSFPTTSAGIAGVLRGGSTVDVYSAAEDDVGNVSVEKALESIKVYKVLNSKLQSLDELDANMKSNSEANSLDYDLVPAFVIVMVNEQQAKTLIYLEKTQALHLALVKAGE